MQPLKATLLDDDAFRLLAIPFGGPIPSPYSPRGVDLDGEWFDEETDIRVKGWLPKQVPVDWHHGFDTYMKSVTIGKAVDPEVEEDGVWVTVWLEHGERRLALIKSLAERGAQLFGSSQAEPLGVRKALTGHIEAWPYVAQALSTSPQNTYSVMRPMKAAMGAPIPDSLRDLATDLRSTFLPIEAGGDGAAMYRRAVEDFDAATQRTLDAIRNQ